VRPLWRNNLLGWLEQRSGSFQTSCRFAGQTVFPQLLNSKAVVVARLARHHGVMDKKRSWLKRFTYDLSRVAVRVVGWLLFGLKLRGIDKFPTAGAAIVCSNHQSYFDPLLLGGLCNRRMNYLAREDLFNSRLFGGLMRWYDAIPVRRDGMSISGLKVTLKRLKRGELVVMFPEGTRTKDGEIAPLKNGFCMLARKAKVPLVPVAIAGAFDVWPKKRRFPWFARISLEAGDPIPAETVVSLSDDELVALLEERIRNCFESARSSHPPKPGSVE
jgi:1-acyl-sn-glycerol-3-phosphate acyltransferase